MAPYRPEAVASRSHNTFPTTLHCTVYYARGRYKDCGKKV